MSKEITDALAALTGTDPYSLGTQLKPAVVRGRAPAAKSSALLPGGNGESGSTELTVAGPKVILSSDGLFALSFPATLEMVRDGTTYTVGVVKKLP